MLPSWLRNSIIAAVSMVWVTSYAAAAIPAFNYEPPPGLNYTFLFVVGAAVALKGKNNGGGDDEP